MGRVFEAKQESLKRKVALKVLSVSLDTGQEQFVRFKREAESAGQLSHPGIVPVYDFGIEGQTPYYAMQLVEGKSLSEIVANSPPSPRLSVHYVLQAAEALEYAHQMGVIHRDVKPGNLMVTRARKVLITDFGLAKDKRQGAGLTLPGTIMGSPRYMSPEQALGDTVDARTDIYSLGVILYELLTGRGLFPSEDTMEMLSHIIMDDPDPPRRFNTGIPVELERIVLKAIEKDAPNRYETAMLFAQDLRRFLKTTVRSTAPSPAPRGRTPAAVWVGGTVAACLLTAVVTFFLMRGKSDPPAAEKKEGDGPATASVPEKNSPSTRSNSKSDDTKTAQGKAESPKKKKKKVPEPTKTTKKMPAEPTRRKIRLPEPSATELYIRGKQFLQKGHYANAIAQWKKVHGKDPRHWKACLGLGDAYRIQGTNLQEALRWYGLALNEEANCVPALIGRGKTHEALRKNTKALADFERAARLAPESLELASNVVQALLHEKAYDRLDTLFRHWGKRGPKDVRVTQGRAAVALHKKRWKEAIKYLGALISSNPAPPQILVQRGRAYLNLKQYAKAIADFDGVIKANGREKVEAKSLRRAALREGGLPLLLKYPAKYLDDTTGFTMKYPGFLPTGKGDDPESLLAQTIEGNIAIGLNRYEFGDTNLSKIGAAMKKDLAKMFGKEVRISRNRRIGVGRSIKATLLTCAYRDKQKESILYEGYVFEMKGYYYALFFVGKRSSRSDFQTVRRFVTASLSR